MLGLLYEYDDFLIYLCKEALLYYSLFDWMLTLLEISALLRIVIMSSYDTTFIFSPPHTSAL